MKDKITRTFGRSDETMARYIKTMEERRANNSNYNPFDHLLDIVLVEFKHWLIVPNEFPYDAIASTNHMLCTKRRVAFDWALLTQDEIKEFEDLRRGYLADNYDALWENLPGSRTVPSHFHLQLLVMRREEM